MTAQHPDNWLLRSRFLLALAALACLGLLACPTAGDDDDSAGDDDDSTETFDVLAEAERFLVGTFDSEAQSISQPQYYAVQLEMCPVDVPDVGERVLYVEQAVMDSLNNPYRQRLYVLEAGEEEDVAVSGVWEFDLPGMYVGTCDDADPREITADDVAEKPGCEVYLTWVDDHFEGGTAGKDCVSTMSGASYATSEVTIFEDRLESWDRGFDDGDQQVWGATQGAYVFDRRSDMVD